MSWTLHDLIKEIEGASSVLRVRSSAMLVNSLAESLKKHIAAMRIDLTKAADVYNAISSSGFPDQQKTELNAAVDGALTTVAPASEAAQTAGKPQILLEPQNVLSKHEWEQLYNPKCFYHDSIVIVCRRLRRLNMSSLHEKTVKACTALLVHVAMDKCGSMPNYADIYKLSHDLRNTFALTLGQKVDNVSSPTTYPSTPEELGTEFMSYAYDSNDPPVRKELKHLADLIANHTPVRNTSALLRSNEQQGLRGLKINPDVVNTLKAIGLKISSPDKLSQSSGALLDVPTSSPREPRAVATPQTLSHGDSIDGSLPLATTSSLATTPSTSPVDTKPALQPADPKDGVLAVSLKPPTLPKLRAELAAASLGPSVEDFENQAMERLKKRRRTRGKQADPNVKTSTPQAGPQAGAATGATAAAARAGGTAGIAPGVAPGAAPAGAGSGPGAAPTAGAGAVGSGAVAGAGSHGGCTKCRYVPNGCRKCNPNWKPKKVRGSCSLR